MAPAALAADLILLSHFAFIVFVATGGLLALRWPRLAWLHLPCLLWGVLVEATGWICPLTPLENRLREVAGQSGYGGGFIEHYLVPLVYPPGLTRTAQIAIGAGLLLANTVIYAVALRNRRRRRGTG